MIQTHHTYIILTDSAPGWCFLPGELEAFHQYGEEGPRSEACRGHRAARSHRCCMLTDSLTDPHLPCTAAKGCTQVAGGGWWWGNGWCRHGRMVRDQSPDGAAAVLSTCARNPHLPGGLQFLFLFFWGEFFPPPKEEEASGAAAVTVLTACCSRRSSNCERALASVLTGAPCSVKHSLLAQTLSRSLPHSSAAAAAADESCTCSAHSEQAQDLEPPPPSSLPPPSQPPSCSDSPSSLDGSLSSVLLI